MYCKKDRIPIPSSNASGKRRGRKLVPRDSEVGSRVTCCKVGLDRLSIPTALVANLFRSVRVSSPGDAPPVGDWETCGRRGRAGQETTARTSLYKTNFSPVLNGRLAEKRKKPVQGRSLYPKGLAQTMTSPQAFAAFRVQTLERSRRAAHGLL